MLLRNYNLLVAREAASPYKFVAHQKHETRFFFSRFNVKPSFSGSDMALYVYCCTPVFNGG